LLPLLRTWWFLHPVIDAAKAWHDAKSVSNNALRHFQAENHAGGATQETKPHKLLTIALWLHRVRT
jgi:hypothetical protein